MDQVQDDKLISAIIIVETELYNKWKKENGYDNEKYNVKLMTKSIDVLDDWNAYNMIPPPHCGDGPPPFYAWVPTEIWEFRNSKRNIEIGTWYLKRLKNYYLKNNYSLETLLASFHWGLENVKKVNYEYNKFPVLIKKYIQKVKNKLWQA